MNHFSRKSAIAVVIISAILVFNLAACGGGGAGTSGSSSSAAAASSSEAVVAEASSSEAAGTEAGGEQSWGKWTVSVPGGFKFKGGDFMDEKDERYFSVKKSELKYFDFKADGEESIKKNYEYNKKTYTNEQVDVKGTFGAGEWVGFQYSDGFGGFGFEAYATVGGELIRVSAAGFKFDSAEAKEVLGSLKYGENAGAAASSVAPGSSAAASSAAPAAVYAKKIELKDAVMGIPEGYTEMKDGSPAQYVTKNDATGGKVTITDQAGAADKRVVAVMGDLKYDKTNYNINGLSWVGAISDGFYCFGTDLGGNSLVITIDFGGSMEEMEKLIGGVEKK